MVQFTICSNHVLFKEGEIGSFFYIVKEGELELKLNESDKTINLKKGHSFGELALIQKTRRSGTVTSLCHTQIFCLEGEIFREIVRKINSTDMQERIYFVKCISIFKGLNNIQLTNIAENMIKCEFKDNDVILSEGDKQESLYIIKEGSVSCIKNGEKIKKLSCKDYFGEISILLETKRSMSISSCNNSVCYQITKSVLIKILGENFRQVLLKSICIEAFLNCKFMKHMIMDHYFDNIFPLFKLNLSKNNQVIIKSKHYEERKIVIIVQGTLIKVIIFYLRVTLMK